VKKAIMVMALLISVGAASFYNSHRTVTTMNEVRAACGLPQLNEIREMKTPGLFELIYDDRLDSRVLTALYFKQSKLQAVYSNAFTEGPAVVLSDETAVRALPCLNYVPNFHSVNNGRELEKR
jgi:hypothetical protein